MSTGVPRFLNPHQLPATHQSEIVSRAALFDDVPTTLSLEGLNEEEYTSELRTLNGLVKTQLGDIAEVERPRKRRKLEKKKLESHEEEGNLMEDRQTQDKDMVITSCALNMALSLEEKYLTLSY